MNPRVTLQPTFSYSISIKSLLENNDDDKAYVVNSARSSLWIALNSLLKDKNKIKKILLPDLICSEIIPIIEQFKLPIVFYSINDQLNPDINFIEQNIKNDLSIILVINYFGNPSNWKDLIELRNSHDCIIIEDNAHSLYGSFDNNSFGNLGDISFNSLRKVLPVLSGSVLKINSALKIATNLPNRFLNFSEFRYSLRSLNPYKKRFKLRANEDVSLTTYDIIQSVDYFSYKIYLSQKNNKDIICNQRRSNYNFWSNFLKESDLEFINLDSSSCPYAMPCLFDDKRVYKKWVNWGIKNNIALIKWPSLPTLSSFKLKNNRLKNILLFPVNHMHNMNDINLSNVKD